MSNIPHSSQSDGPAEKPGAIVITSGLLHEPDAKTAHGLIRGTERYTILAVIDAVHAGKDAGEVLDGVHRGIPVYANAQEAIAALGHNRVRYAVIGVATVGGLLPAPIAATVKECLRSGISVVNGLHDYLQDMPEMVELARTHGAELIDIRRPKKRQDLHFWSGRIFQVTAPVIAVIGMDCAIGKRTTCRMVRQVCESAGINAAMIYTGQTGWLQGGRYGFIFDSTLNDFISGEIEHAIFSCWEETGAQVIFVEGQSALRNPSGPCGSEFIISGNARHTILIHAPKRKYYDHLPEWGAIPSVASEIDLIRDLGSTVIALALNTEDCTDTEALAFQQQYQKELGIRVLLPLQQGVASVIPLIRSLIQ